MEKIMIQIKNILETPGGIILCLAILLLIVTVLIAVTCGNHVVISGGFGDFSGNIEMTPASSR